MPREFSRTQRVADQMQRLIAQIVSRELKDPRIGMVTINSVDVSRDLGYADVYFTLLNLNEQDANSDDVIETGKILNHASGFIRTELAKQMKMRHIPHVRFHFDQSVGYGRKLSTLIDDAIHQDEVLSATRNVSGEKSGDQE
jgi:ribosome-binding factor A